MTCQGYNPSINSPIHDPSIVCTAFSEQNFNPEFFPTPSVTDNNASKSINTTDALFSFNTQLSPDGIFLSLKSFQSSCKGYLHLLGPCNHFLQIIKSRIPTNEVVDSPTMEDVSDSQGQPEPKRLAIGVEGGFDGRGFTEEVKYYLATISDQKLYHCELDLCPNQHVQNLVSYIIAATSIDTQEISAWEGDVREIDENLLTYPLQPITINSETGLPNYPDLTKCCINNCTKTENLWINLGTGFVGCGRKYYDGTGGNNHGIEHFQKEGDSTARYSIKIGTISSNLEAIDIYDMKEDKFVKDPIIIDHLKHWGIDPKKMSKTEKTITEMEIDLNKKFGNEWDIIQEKGKDLKPASSFGIENLGSTCYLSAVIQALLQMPKIQERFCDRDQYHNYIQEKLSSQDLNNPKTFQDFLMDPEFQTRKLFSSLANSPISALGEHVNIRPLQFKIVVGENHPEFKLWSQQDSLEWMQHFFDFLDRKCKNENNPSKFFNISIEDRLECLQSNKFRSIDTIENVIQLPINLDDRTTDPEKNEKTNLIPFEKTLSRYFSAQPIEDFHSPATDKKGIASKTIKLKTLPDILVLQVGKFYFDEAWQPKKYNVEVDMPNEINLSVFKTNPENDKISEDQMLPDAPPREVEVDMEKVNQLVGMGYELYACKRAIHATNEVMAAFEWLLSHENDSDLHEPLFQAPEGGVAKNSSSKKTENTPPVDTSMITSMGFTHVQALYALKQTNNDIARAADWIFSNMDEIANITEAPIEEIIEGNQSSSKPNSKPAITDGSGQYSLRAFVSHMGSNANTGHYVCHVRHDLNKDDWVIFNDDKACHSVDAPKKLGYLYYYQRQ